MITPSPLPSGTGVMPAFAAVARPIASAPLKMSDRTIRFSFLQVMLPVGFCLGAHPVLVNAAPYCRVAIRAIKAAGAMNED
jgi:hypothetical protein